MTSCRRIRLVILTAILLLSLPARAAQAVTIRDIVELTRAGLSDDIIMALLEADPTIFSLDAKMLMQLRREGVSERVLIEMLRSGRRPSPAPVASIDQAPAGALAPNPPAPAPQVVVIDHHEPAPEVSYVPYPVFVVPVHPRPRPHRPSRPILATEPTGFGRFLNDGFRRTSDGHRTSFGRFINDGSLPPSR